MFAEIYTWLTEGLDLQGDELRAMPELLGS